jgi:hypothetical protein
MIMLSDQQFRTFRSSAAEDFIRRLSASVRKHHLALVWDKSDEELRTLLIDLTRTAMRLGISIEHDVGRFVDLNIRLGPLFYLEPENQAARAILEDPARSGTQKVLDLFFLVHPVPFESASTDDAEE